MMVCVRGGNCSVSACGCVSCENMRSSLRCPQLERIQRCTGVGVGNRVSTPSVAGLACCLPHIMVCVKYAMPAVVRGLARNCLTFFFLFLQDQFFVMICSRFCRCFCDGMKSLKLPVAVALIVYLSCDHSVD